MSTAQPVANEQLVTQEMNRLVWVLNSHNQDYTEEFRGDKITVPANNQKIYKRIEEGGSLMPYLAARKFLGQPKAAGQILPDGTWYTPPKSLRTEEMTITELNQFKGVKPETTTEVVEVKSKGGRPKKETTED